MGVRETGQITGDAAEIYDDLFVPALFQQWGGRVADAAQIVRGQRVLDVACGTGVLAQAVADRVGPDGSVTGVDVNAGMLAVARRKALPIEWRTGRAEALPFASEQFDAVVSQFGLMFFEDRREALREMVRVLRPGGRLAVAVWDRLESSPGYAAMAALLRRLFGDAVASALYAPFALGDIEGLRSLFMEAGIVDADVRTEPGTARFPSLDTWLYTDIRGWTLADTIDDAQFDRLRSAAGTALHQFVTQDGSVEFAAPAHIVTATKP